MSDPTMPEVPPLEVLWALYKRDLRRMRCDNHQKGNSADKAICFLRAHITYRTARAELVRQQERHNA